MPLAEMCSVVDMGQPFSMPVTMYQRDGQHRNDVRYASLTTKGDHMQNRNPFIKALAVLAYVPGALGGFILLISVASGGNPVFGVALIVLGVAALLTYLLARSLEWARENARVEQ